MRLGLPLLLVCACGGASPSAVSPDPAADRSAVAEVLDAWHAAAADADEDAYFALLTADAIFLGTDATERWTKTAFRTFAHPHFARGEAWTFRAIRRDVLLEGDLAWFDEDLETEGLGPARGSGVLRRTPEGWRIVHYNLALTIPNERFREVHDLLASPAPEADVEPPGDGPDPGASETEGP